MDFCRFVVKGTNDESGDIRTFRLAPEDGAMPKYKAGHFFLLRLSDESGKMAQRPYSAASLPEEGELRFCIKLKGAFTHLLWSLKPGDFVEVGGPYGVFLLGEGDGERVFIGGGVGISSLRAMILQTVRHDGKRAHLFHSAHAFSGLPYYNEMRSLELESPLFKYHPSISGGEPPQNWEGLRGRIDAAMLKSALGSLAGKTFYLCGSKEMALALSDSLISEGVPRELIRKDEWG